MKVAVLDSQGTYSELAANKQYGAGVRLVYFPPVQEGPRRLSVFHKPGGAQSGSQGEGSTECLERQNRDAENNRLLPEEVLGGAHG
ncbi:MAG: hypothetical protein AB1476_03540 [Candidatus Hadarchaeota archaeon]